MGTPGCQQFLETLEGVDLHLFQSDDIDILVVVLPEGQFLSLIEQIEQLSTINLKERQPGCQMGEPNLEL
jgi:hypothetical protein